MKVILTIIAVAVGAIQTVARHRGTGDSKGVLTFNDSK